MFSQTLPCVSLLSTVLTATLTNSDSEKAIASILELTARYFGVNRIYLMERDANAFFTSCEWCREGTSSIKEKRQRTPLTQFYVYMHHFTKDHIFAVPDTTTLNGTLRTSFQERGACAVLQVATFIQGRAVGLIGVDDCERIREWSAEEIATLQLISQSLSAHFLNYKLEQRSRLNKSIAFSILNELEFKLYVIDVETHKLLYANDSLVQAIPEIELGKPCYQFFEPGASGPCTFCPVETYHRNPCITTTCFDVHNPRLDVWATINGSIFEWLDGKKICVMRASDITLKRDHEVRLSQIAYTDELTGIPNNRSYRHNGPILLTTAEEQDLNVAVIAIKVESLHRINSVTGYEQGDAILKDFTEKVSRAIPGESVFARVRGNDFAILYPFSKSYDNAHVRAQVQRIFLAVAEVQVPASVRGQLSVAAGVSIFPTDGDQFEDLNRKAGLALALNKTSVLEPYAFYDAALAAKQLASDKLAQDLAVALRNDELEIYYQPKYDVGTRCITGTEALLRWRHPVHGLMVGGAFIQLAEDHGLISEIDDWVINESCRNIRQLINAGCKPVPVAINLSPDKFYQDDILNKLTGALKRYDVAPSLLEVEITERIALENIDKATGIMHRIRGLGITLSIDDFGTGYSSLNYLRILPIDAVKLDRSFLTDIEHSPTARNIVDFIVRLAGLLRFSVIMEGIETREQFEFARQIKCDVVQGYYTGRPVPLDGLKKLLLQPKALADLPRNSPFLQSLRHYFTPASLVLWALALGGAILGAVAMSGILAEYILENTVSEETHATLHKLLTIAGLFVISFAGLSAFLVWKCRAVSVLSRQTIQNMIRMCKDAYRGAPMLQKMPTLNIPDDLLTEFGNELNMTTRKIHSGNAELMESKAQYKELSLELLRRQAAQRITAESVSDILWEIDLSAKNVHFSQRFTTLFGHSRREFCYPDEFLTLVHPDDKELYSSRISILMAGEVAGRELEFRIRTAAGAYIWMHSTGAVLYSESGDILRFVGALSPISDLKKTTTFEDGGTDHLTGLLNHLSGKGRALAGLEENTNGLALFMMDIRAFKSINQKYGRLCGDSVLRRIARRLETFCAPGDILFRYGGDEFALLKVDCSDPVALEQCSASLTISLAQSCVHHKVEIPLRCDIAAIFIEPGVTADGSELFHQARQAMKSAQATSRFIALRYQKSKPLQLPWEIDFHE